MAKSKYKPKPTWNVPANQKTDAAAPSVKPLRISQCMIVKDEEKNIERALSWGKDIMCEQIVVDTGSTDRTVEIAERMGAKVYHFAWINDFAAAKNYALEQATGDWIAFLDADEYLNEETAKKLPQFLDGIRAANQKGPVVIIATLANLNDSGQIFHLCAQVRIFSNHPHLRYARAIHEDLVSISPETCPTYLDVSSTLTIFHTGYALNVRKEKNKELRNITALRGELAKHPDDLLCKGYLAESLDASGENPAEAEDLFREMISIPLSENDDLRMRTLQSNAFRHLMEKYIQREQPVEDFRRLYTKATSRYPSIPDYDYYMGVRCFMENDYTQALPFFLQSEEKGNCFISNGYQSQMSELLPHLYQHISICFEKNNDLPSAIRYAVLVLKKEPYDQQWLTSFLNVLTREDFHGTAQATMNLLGQLYDFSKLKDKLILLKCAKAIGNEPLYALIYGKFTPEEKTWFESK
ncbi:MAG: glycosyltransferase family 2 protein [Clostridia bacterium]|nr:glycosyltransferase family 2 protein [Clostridia bacterium]